MEEERSKKEDKENKEEELPPEKIVTTQHRLSWKGKPLSYAAHAGTLPIRNEEEKVIGHLFFVAYTQNKVSPKKRPILFAFNGGPGSSSVWLHMAAWGPKKVVLDPEGEALPPPASYEKNPYSLLPYADLVFIDPMGTGFSRSHPKKEIDKYFSVKNDMEVVAEFIRLFLTRYKRWGSPKYVGGESYGGTRAAYLAHHLHTRMGISLNGLIFVAPALNLLALLEERDTNQVAYACSLPSFAATAWYHKKGWEKKSLDTVIKETVSFVDHEYFPFLFKGSTASKKSVTAITKQLSAITGLSTHYLELCNQRVSVARFTKELLRDTYTTVGRLDSRFTGKDRDSAGEVYEYDPSYSTVHGSCTAAFHDYLTHELHYTEDITYHILSEKVHAQWKWYDDPKVLRNIDFSDPLRQTLMYNRFLRVFIVNGYYDLATPFHATDFTLHHIEQEPGIQERITSRYYPAGHMMYSKESVHKEMSLELASFLHDS